MSKSVAYVGVLVASLTIGVAQAGSIGLFNDRATFDTAVGSTVTETFTETSHFPISTGVLNSATNLPGIGLTPGMIQPGVTYSTAIGTSFFFNIDSGGGFDGGFLDGFTQQNGNPLTITFDSALAAFGFDTNSLMGSEFDITINFVSDPSFSTTLGVTGPQFFGFQSSLSDILSVVIESNGTSGFAFALDNFSFNGTPRVPVPEPASLLLLGAGLAGLAAVRRRRAAR